MNINSKRFFPIGVFSVAAVLVFAGCSTPPPPEVPVSDVHVTIMPEVLYDVYVPEVLFTKSVNSDFLTIQAEAVSLVDRQLPIEWKAQWLDAAGVEIDSVVSTWKSLVLQNFETRGLKSTAPSRDAKSVRLYVRKIK